MEYLFCTAVDFSCTAVTNSQDISFFAHRSFIEESKAGIKISPLDNTYYGLSDRLVTLSGTFEEQMRAIDLILAKLTEDDHYSQNVHSPYSYAGISTQY